MKVGQTAVPKRGRYDTRDDGFRLEVSHKGSELGKAGMHGVHDTEHVPLRKEPGEGKHKETHSALAVIILTLTLSLSLFLPPSLPPSLSLSVVMSTLCCQLSHT